MENIDKNTIEEYSKYYNECFGNSKDENSATKSINQLMIQTASAIIEENNTKGTTEFHTIFGVIEIV